jgi:phytoene dehydrogenase-like protein
MRLVARSARVDATVIGAGPNGLAAAICLARAGCPVTVFEAEASVGGGMRSAALTQPGFLHDVCSTIHPLAVASPFLSTLPLHRHGLAFIDPPIALAHPLDGDDAVFLHRSLDATAAGLGDDGTAYHRLVTPLVQRWPMIDGAVLGPLRWPRHPLAVARFGLVGLRSIRALADARFSGSRARALLAGLGAHSMLRLDEPPSAAIAVILAVLAHRVGWPIARGGSQRIAAALEGHLRTLGGDVVTGRRIVSLDELQASPLILCDVSPRGILELAGHRLPVSYRRRLEGYRHGVGVFKVDWAVNAPIPWRAAECAQAGTVHLGGTFEEIEAAERDVARGQLPERPFVILAQPSLFDPGRAPRDRHTAWAYCHVPNGATEDMTAAIERQIERFAPGFGATILGRHAMRPADLERYNANYVGGDINGGRQDLGQLFARPVARLVPYATPAHGVFMCSSATPPGGGVHGMCGYWAAAAAMRAFGLSPR